MSLSGITSAAPLKLACFPLRRIEHWRYEVER